MKKIHLLILCFISLFSATAQDKAFYVELGGPGLASINYDMRLNAGKPDGFGFRAGVGGFNIDKVGLLTIPVGVNYLLGNQTKNYFEFGAGATYINASEEWSNDEGNFKSTFGWLNFGYRYQPQDKGFMFRAAINPVFGKFGFLPYYGGLAVGYKF